MAKVMRVIMPGLRLRISGTAILMKGMPLTMKTMVAKTGEIHWLPGNAGAVNPSQFWMEGL